VAALSRDGDVILLGLEEQERVVLAGMAVSLVEMLAGEDEAVGAGEDPLVAMVGLTDDPVAAPDDPALRRLLPDAYADDEAAGEFRRYTDATLREGKVAALTRIADALTASGDAPVGIPLDQAHDWLTAINDLRLVLGVRLDITDDREDPAELPGDDPRLPLFAAYDWLTYLQDTLVGLVTGDPTDDWVS
jgi:hypothetical protein